MGDMRRLALEVISAAHAEATNPSKRRVCRITRANAIEFLTDNRRITRQARDAWLWAADIESVNGFQHIKLPEAAVV